MKLQNHINKQFGDLTVLGVGPNKVSKSGRTYKTFVCQCKCNKIITKQATNIISGGIKNCGCRKHKLGKGESSFQRVYKQYMKTAMAANREFALTEHEVRTLTSANCYYCNTGPSNTMNVGRAYGEYKYNGIDRVNNDHGYTITNVVTCCKHCNYAKRNMTLSDFLNLIQKIYQHRIEPSTYLNYQTKD